MNDQSSNYIDPLSIKNAAENNDEEEFDTDDDEDEEEDDKKSELNITDTSTSIDYSKHLTYEGDLCIYTEPNTNRQLIWDVEKKAWMPRNTESTANNDDNPMKNYEFDGKNYIYTNKETNITYKYDQEKNEWVEKSTEELSATNEHKTSSTGLSEATMGGTYGFENDTHTYTDPNDGTVYIWDREKSAWFPKIDDDFMARYQMSYGFTDPNTGNKSDTSSAQCAAKNVKVDKEQKKAEAKRKAAEPPTWFEIDQAHNTSVYISGLPLDITMDELVELVGKCGLVARDDKNKDKIKLYKDSDGNPKGDALCTYIKVSQ